MSIWIDLSTTLTSAGVNGTVRTELELAKSLHRADPSIRFFKATPQGFVALTERDIPWFFASDLVVDAFLSTLDKKRKGAADRLLAHALSYSPSGVRRLRYGLLLLASLLPRSLGALLYWLLRPFFTAGSEFLFGLTIVFGKKNPRPPRADDPISHPFQPGDVLFSVGIDWGSLSIRRLRRLRKEVGTKFVQVVHDLTPIVVPHFHHQLNQDLYLEFFRAVSLASDRILYISKQTQKDGLEVQRKYALPEVPSAIITWGCRLPSFSDASPERDAEYLSQHGISTPYFAIVSTIEARKNHDTIYLAYRRLVQKHGAAMPQLVFVGHPGWKTSELLKTIERDSLVHGKLIRIGPSDRGLDILYRNAAFTLYPSLYEGWGLPIVESLAYGKPVIAAANTSLLEAGEGWADFVDAWNIGEWMRQIERYCFDEGFRQQTTKRIEQGYQHRTWEACGAQVMQQLKELT